MSHRIFTDAERASLSRKPAEIAEMGGVSVSAERLAHLVGCAWQWDGSLPHLDRLAKISATSGDVEFVAVSGARVAFVNTEGYDYARYAGLVREVS